MLEDIPNKSNFLSSIGDAIAAAQQLKKMFEPNWLDIKRAQRQTKHKRWKKGLLKCQR